MAEEKRESPQKLIEEAKMPFISPEIYSPLHQISDKFLIEMLFSPNFATYFDRESIWMEPEYLEEYNPETEARQWLRHGLISAPKIRGKDNVFYRIILNRDPDNIGITVENLLQGTPVLYINFRDRRFDGLPEASSPRYLREIGHMEENEIPPRCHELGGTRWFYSNESVDKLEDGRASIELSIALADPKSHLRERLRIKRSKGKLWIDDVGLLKFIHDPFAQIPKDPEDLESLNRWYLMWFQVVNRALRGKLVPFPGQITEYGLGCFNEVIGIVSELAKALDFSDISVVPTWHYVRDLFIKNGFKSEKPAQEEQEELFFAALEKIQLPEFSIPFLRRNNFLSAKGKLIGDIVDPNIRSALMSWYMELAYILALNPNIKPSLNSLPNIEMNPEFLLQLNEVLDLARDILCQPTGVITHPLFPGHNVWYYLVTGK